MSVKYDHVRTTELVLIWSMAINVIVQTGLVELTVRMISVSKENVFIYNVLKHILKCRS